MTSFGVIIPARLSATRLPGKPLLDVAGKPLVIRVAEAAASSSADRIVVATDDDDIFSVVKSAGFDAVMTPADCPSGTDRIASAIKTLAIDPATMLVNVQGDEPDMPGELIDQVAQALVSSKDAVMSTACTRIDNDGDWNDPSVVKVVRDANDNALYFSRASIPATGDRPDEPQAMRHIGIYGYRAGFVTEFASRPPAPIEVAERLEQLRVLWHGERIAVCEAIRAPGPGVDTPADLERVRQQFSKTAD